MITYFSYNFDHFYKLDYYLLLWLHSSSPHTKEAKVVKYRREMQVYKNEQGMEVPWSQVF